MRRGRRLLLAVVLGTVPLAGCDGSAADRSGALAPVSESLPPGASWQAGASPAAPSRGVLAPEEPARTVLPGDAAPAGTRDPAGDGDRAGNDGRGRARPAPRESRSRPSVLPDRRTLPGPAAGVATPDSDVPSATPKPSAKARKPATRRTRKPKKSQNPAPVTAPATPAEPDPAAAPTTPAAAAARQESGAVPAAACGDVGCR
ncbi:hypothetical protein ACTOB_006103 [Actinoplanes oblitus]|uniref:Uncharacterized protein n=1 Tax=Actinoplanes oblitus TaxID=3040509 RepID=A0ABY8W9C6_9ACTN|nr:hypothetical protein [Actinoplanes oblitus]WIM94102.1 hypothetical protein ACTOB_006103 [Actinoplanes oblitus]